MMTGRETIWRITFGALAIFSYVMAFASIDDLGIAALYALSFGLLWFMATCKTAELL